MYFLLLVILQVFPIFGATTPQIAMLPLLAILAITAIKDGIEDYRRATLDEEVNNSAATKLGDWRNVNQPADPRTTLEKLMGHKNPRTSLSPHLYFIGQRWKLMFMALYCLQTRRCRRESGSFGRKKLERARRLSCRSLSRRSIRRTSSQEEGMTLVERGTTSRTAIRWTTSNPFVSLSLPRLPSLGFFR
jgi:hypothetical protein